jgi:DtxR family Mn-dependent transcriptional regulator
MNAPALLTSTEENYLKAVFALAQPRIGTNALADRVQTKASSATDMIQRLAEKGLVEYERYRGVGLTPSGRVAAAAVIRRHRLWEVFLAEKLGFGWHEVHDLAEELEHVQSPELIRRLDAFLDTPSYDPHGDPIPRADGTWPTAAGIRLDQVPVGQHFSVAGAADRTDELLDYLHRVGMVPGTEWTLSEIVPFDGTRTVQTRSGRTLDLSALAARHVLVQPQEHPADEPLGPSRRDLLQWGDETPYESTRPSETQTPDA